MSIPLLVLTGWIGANLAMLAAIGLAAMLRGQRARRQVARLEAWLHRTPLAPRSPHTAPLARSPERVGRGS